MFSNSIMQQFAIVLSFLSIFLITAIRGESNCNAEKTHLYDEIRCKPVKENDGACPKSYDCSHYKLTTTACNFRGELVPLGDDIDAKPCDAKCYCKYGEERKSAIIRCEVVGCRYSKAPKDCYLTMNFATCCPDALCEGDEGYMEPKCLVDGQMYEIGKSFSPKDTCLNCMCTKDFVEGQYEDASYCIPHYCRADVDFGPMIALNCAAVYIISNRSDKNYYQRSVCCPHSFLCEGHLLNRKIDVITHGDNDKPELKCRLGQQTFNYKDTFKTIYSGIVEDLVELTCSCDVPPLITCYGEMTD